MKGYVKPDFYITRFAASNAIAVDCTYVDATTPSETTVHCVIGNQQETVFYTECRSTANKYKIVNHSGTDDDYFVWFTYVGDTASESPSEEATQKLDELVKEAGYEAGPGWHYAKVVADGTDGYYNLNFS